jgi:hypothetical protein
VALALVFAVDRQGLTSAADNTMHVLKPAQHPGFFQQQVGHILRRGPGLFHQGAGPRQAGLCVTALAKGVVQSG